MTRAVPDLTRTRSPGEKELTSTDTHDMVSDHDMIKVIVM